MIYDELRSALVVLGDEHDVQNFDDAVTVFDKYNVPDYLGLFEQTFARKQGLGDQAVLDALKLDVRNILDALFQVQGVSLSEEALLSERLVLADALFEVPYHEDKELLQSVLESEQTVQEKFAELMSIMTRYTPDEVLALVEEIDNAFVINFTQILAEKERITAFNTDAIRAHIEAFSSLVRFSGNTPLYAHRFFEHAGGLGVPLKDYLAWYQRDKPEAFQSVEPKGMALELLALGCLAGDAVKTPWLVVRGELSALFADPQVCMKVDLELTKLNSAWGQTK